MLGDQFSNVQSRWILRHGPPLTDKSLLPRKIFPHFAYYFAKNCQAFAAAVAGS
jgi:hypothetical protein